MSHQLPRTQVPPAAARSLGLPTNAPQAPTTGERFDVERTVLAGGDVANQTLLRGFTIFERLYRAEAEEGMFDPVVSKENPFEFSLGAFTVPVNMALLVYNMRPDIYRFSGVDPGDFVPVEARRFGSIMGFELKVAEQHRGNLDMQIDPVPIQRTSSQAYESNNITSNATQGQFARGRSGQLGTAQGSSQVLLPQRPTRYGAPDPVPFTLYVDAGQTIEARCSIFRPVPTPIAFIEFDISGLLVPTNFMSKMEQALKPPQLKGEEAIR